MIIRSLAPITDAAAVTDLYTRAADYVWLETGDAPNPSLTTDFFTDAPPGIDPATSLRLGLFKDTQLVAIAELAFGYPNPEDAYLGLMLIDPAHRNQGIGPHFLNHIIAQAKQRHAPRLLLAVLDENPKGRAFWERMGFRVVLTAPTAQIGRKTHIRHRMERPL